ncbi:MAG TPA: OmpH family outer membrane protein [Victivallales bacterium]|nr:OmpH family outer membrane protein [Victivallales bacterium]HPO89678.1 OmpH family outer membrane protein [Victivallales bacterium]HRR06535.1 OmpH family outer membrane protein [Victivallales bacterium]HRR27950.1 OmpH family outer membrane protein [Victivallales bacterium]HRU00606.1 OmpH family outer membrane protein [Victivallales bacterium]
MKKLIFFILGTIFSLQISAQDKIAVVDMDELFNGYYKKKIADIELKKQAETYKQYADNLGESLGKLQEEFKKLRDDSLNIALSDVERENKRLAAQDKYRQMKEKEEELKSYSIEKQNIIKAKYEEIREELITEIKAVIARVATKNNFSIVIDKSGKTLNQIPAIVYFNQNNDITKIVLKELNPELDSKDNIENNKKNGE